MGAAVIELKTSSYHQLPGKAGNTININKRKLGTKCKAMNFLVIGVKRRQRPMGATKITEGFSEEVMFATPAGLKRKASGFWRIRGSRAPEAHSFSRDVSIGKAGQSLMPWPPQKTQGPVFFLQGLVRVLAPKRLR